MVTALAGQFGTFQWALPYVVTNEMGGGFWDEIQAADFAWQVTLDLNKARALTEAMRKRAKRLVVEHWSKVEAVAKVLLASKTRELSGDEVRAVIRGTR